MVRMLARDLRFPRGFHVDARIRREMVDRWNRLRIVAATITVTADDGTTQATQTGCTYTVVADAYTGTGTIDAAGVVDQTCDVEGGMHCSGAVDGSTFTLLCVYLIDEDFNH